MGYTIQSRRNLDPATLWHGVNAVVCQIKKELQEAVAITRHERQDPIEIDSYRYIMRIERRLDQPQQLADQCIQIEWLQLRPRPLSPGQQTSDALHN